MTESPTAQDRPRPKRLSIPASRSLVADLLYFHQRMPTVSHVQSFDLGKLAELRGSDSQPISWCLLFMKAYAQVAQRRAPLRQTWMSWPWPHLYEHPSSVANLAMTREHHGEEWLFFAPLYDTHSTPLAKLQSQLQDYKSSPVKNVFATQLRLAKMPLVLRRILWWLRLHYSGRKRVKRLGTFGLTTLAGQGTTIVDPKAPITTVLSYGPLDDQGQCQVTIAYDHRIMDGSFVARVLSELQAQMNHEIVSEYEERLSTTPTSRQAA